MIVIIEPQCKEITHEKVNSGFIYGLHLAFPNDKILFYAHLSHITAIKYILKHDKVLIKNIEYIPINFLDSKSFIGIFKYYLFFKKLFSIIQKKNINKIFFLSFTPPILYLIKNLKQNKKYKDFKFSFVLHGDFENISNEKNEFIPPIVDKKPLLYRLKKLYSKHFFKKIIFILKNVLNKYNFLMRWNHLIISNLFQTKKIILWNNTDDYKYIALSSHIIKNAKNYIDIKSLNINLLTLPIIFVEPLPMPINNHVKFATFGYGNSSALKDLLLQLSEKTITKPYEIRIIGMDDRGIDGFQNVTCSSPGKRLDRIEMEKQAKDIDVFLILHNKNRYKLSCSNSILESLSYMKPVLHLNNDCINNFNKIDLPIGICCESNESLANTMYDIIENYSQFRDKAFLFRKNIFKLRAELSIENSIDLFEKAFHW